MASPPPPPPGFKWIVNEAFTDEFNGDQLDLNKWYDHHPWWQGRPPARFMPWTVSVNGGFMRIQNDVLDPPQGDYNIAGGAVVSRTTAAFYGYYEARMKASKISMSSTFWMSNPKLTVDGVTSSQEIDIQETIGAPHSQPGWAANWHRRMNSNTHFKYSHDGTSTTYSVGDHVVVSPPAPETGEDFHVYGAWWVDANTIHFYHDNRFVYTLRPSTAIVPHPFDRPMHINMVAETYDWMAPPDIEDLTNPAINTTYYDWVRSYVLVPNDAPPPLPAVVWQDQLPRSAATILLGQMAIESGVPDPLGGTNLASRFYYPDPTHPEYRNMGINGDINGFYIPGLDTAVRTPVGGGYQYANIDAGYRGRPFKFTADVFVPSSSELGNDPSDSLQIFIRWKDGKNATLVTTPGDGANLRNHGQWQTLSITGTSPTMPSITRVAPLLAIRDAGSRVAPNTTVYYLRNLDFELVGPPVPPRLQYSLENGHVVLDWDQPGFRLQSRPMPVLSAPREGWVNYPLPEGANPPVKVDPGAGDGPRMFRLIGEP